MGPPLRAPLRNLYSLPPGASRALLLNPCILMNTVLKSSLALLATGIALLSQSAARAQSFTFNVDLVTANLAQDAANAPFDLDFQLNNGNGTVTNTVTLSNFVFSNGSALGSATTNGLATGDLTSAVVLTANSTSQFNELFQQFSAGTTNISFTATVSQNGSGSTPTEFAAAILDNSLGFPAQIYTTAPDTASLVTLNLGTANTLSNVGTFTSTASADGQTPVTGVSAAVIPEPATTAALYGSAAVLLAFGARRFRGVKLV